MTKFERDKVYKTRGGAEAFVVSTNAPGGQPVVALLRLDEDRWIAHQYCTDGSWLGYDHGPHNLDLMLPKPEPVVEWGYIGPDGAFYINARHPLDIRGKPFPRAKRTTEIVE
jgi:hypothetical protein